MPAKTLDITYTDVTLPGDSKVPVLWWFQLKDTAGSPVGSEQQFPDTTATVKVSAPAGTYTLTGGQRDDTGAEMGTPVTSDPFELIADIVVKFVGTITITKG